MNEINTYENKTNLKCISAASCHSAVGGIRVTSLEQLSVAEFSGE